MCRGLRQVLSGVTCKLLDEAGFCRCQLLRKYQKTNSFRKLKCLAIKQISVGARSILMFIFGRLHVYKEQQPEKYMSYFSKNSCFSKGAQRDRPWALTEPALAYIDMHGYHSDISRPLTNTADPHWERGILFLHPSPQTGFFFKKPRFLRT